jgi:exo-beta-1,3-glucanase (GH17 family)
MSIVHPWFAVTTVQDAATWSFAFFKETSVDVANTLANKPQMYIGETGWPTADSSTTPASNTSVRNLQIFINDFVCPANLQGLKYFFYEFTDIPWKAQQFTAAEGHFGLFNSDKTLKEITLPDCSHG